MFNYHQQILLHSLLLLLIAFVCWSPQNTSLDWRSSHSTQTLHLLWSAAKAADAIQQAMWWSTVKRDQPHQQRATHPLKIDMRLPLLLAEDFLFVAPAADCSCLLATTSAQLCDCCGSHSTWALHLLCGAAGATNAMQQARLWSTMESNQP